MESMDKAKRNYTERVELHCHTGYSRRKSVASVKGVLQFAQEQGMTAVAITDDETVCGYPEMQSRAEDSATRCKPIYGLEVEVTEDREDYGNAKGEKYHVMLLVKNRVGLRTLYRLISQANLRKAEVGRPVYYMSELLNHRENLLLGAACDQGQLERLMTKRASEEELKRAASTYDYVEIMPGREETFVKQMISLTDSLSLPLVAVSNVHFLRKENAISYEVVLETAGEKYIERGNGTTGNGTELSNLFFHTTEEMLSAFSYLGEDRAYELVVENSNLLAEQVERICPISRQTVYICNTLEDDERLEKLCLDGLQRKYINRPGITENMVIRARERMKMELSMVKEYHHAYYFLLFYDLIHQNHLHPSQYSLRGCGAGSILCYLLDISHADPLKEEVPLYYEFLIGFVGHKLPDIDMNVDEKAWAEVIASVAKLRGVKTTYRATTLTWPTERRIDQWLGDYMRIHGELSEKVMEQIRNDCECVVEEKISFHPGGVVLIPEGVEEEEYVPIDYDVETGRKFLHFGYYDIGQIFDKIDILQHNNCTLNAGMYEATKVYPSDAELDDLFKQENILSLLESIPGYQNQFMRRLLHKLQPHSVAELIKIECLTHGTGTWLENGEELLDEGIADLENIISNREDIFETLMQYGMESDIAFDIADFVRKGKMRRSTDRGNALRTVMSEYDIPSWYIHSCEKIMYLFPRAHSAEYVIMELGALYYKIFYPQVYEKVYDDIYNATKD